MPHEKFWRFICLASFLIAAAFVLSACGVSPEDIGREAGKAVRNFMESLAKGFQEGCCTGSAAVVFLPSLALVFGRIKKR